MINMPVRRPRLPQPKPFPAWPDLRRSIAAPQMAAAHGKEGSPEWCDLVADMIVGRKSQLP